MNRRLFARRLAAQGATVEESIDGREAVEAASQSAYDVMLIDLEMPVLDGFRAVERIRETDSDTPIVALSGYADGPTERRCLEIGFNALLMKPINVGRLPEMLRGIIAKCAAEAHDGSRMPHAERAGGGELE